MCLIRIRWPGLMTVTVRVLSMTVTVGYYRAILITVMLITNTVILSRLKSSLIDKSSLQ